MKAPAVRSLRRLTVYTRSNPALQLSEGLLTVCVLTCNSRGHGHPVSLFVSRLAKTNDQPL